MLDRFLRYVQIDTTSDPNSETVPSTARQTGFAKMLAEDCASLGLSGVTLSYEGVVMATLPGNTEAPVIGFIAHMDTSSASPGEGIKPQVHKYQGGDLPLGHGLVLSPAEFPALARHAGQTLITASGNTLLGADNKAGIVEILAAMEFLLNNPQIKHGTVRVALTPDEEVGHGADHFDVAKFGAAFGYTVDGGETGQLEIESFNAARAQITVAGKSVHPGTAKGVMKNAALVAMELNGLLPAGEIPANTAGYEGFFHLDEIMGGVEHCSLDYIIRDHDQQKFAARKQMMEQTVAAINGKYGAGTAVLKLTDQYRNMREVLERHPQVTELAAKAMRINGIEPVTNPIRGGTDGSRLSFMGLPCPNIFTGGANFHGPYEYIPVEEMGKAVKVIISICELGCETL